MNKFLKRTLLASCMISLCPTIASADKAMIVFDGSGSMWAQLNGEAKISIARETLTKVLGSVPTDLELGLIAYGHREKGQCTDIEQVMEPAAGQGSAIAKFVNKLQPKGKTPLTDAVEMAADSLEYTEQKATVILITDGIETCNADPCAVAKALEEKGVDFTTHVIGFGLNAEQRKKVACIAENTGGQYLDANNAESLSDALTETVAAAPVVQPKPVKAPEPVITESKVKMLAYLDDEGTIAKPLRVDWKFEPVNGGKTVKGKIFSDGRTKITLKTGKYKVSGKPFGDKYHNLGVKIKDFEVEISGKETKIETVLNAAIVEYTIAVTKDAEPAGRGRIELRAGDSKKIGYRRLRALVPAGQLEVDATLGNAALIKKLKVEAGQFIEERLVPESGVVKVRGVYSENGPDVESSIYFVVNHAKKDLNGKQKRVEHASSVSKNFVLKPGKYSIRSTLGLTKILTEVTVTPGDVQDMVINFNAGVLYVESNAAKKINITGGKKDINGKVKRIHTIYSNKKKNLTIPAGTYNLHIDMKDGTKKTQQVTVKAGEREEVIIK